MACIHHPAPLRPSVMWDMLSKDDAAAFKSAPITGTYLPSMLHLNLNPQQKLRGPFEQSTVLPKRRLRVRHYPRYFALMKCGSAGLAAMVVRSLRTLDQGRFIVVLVTCFLRRGCNCMLCIQTWRADPSAKIAMFCISPKSTPSDAGTWRSMQQSCNLLLR